MQISFHSIIKVATIFFLILFSQTATNAQEKKLKIGDTAPELKLIPSCVNRCDLGKYENA